MTAGPDREDLLVRVTTCSTLAAAVPGSVAQRQLLLPTAPPARRWPPDRLAVRIIVAYPEHSLHGLTINDLPTDWRPNAVSSVKLVPFEAVYELTCHAMGR
jgi:hypothetical protein